MYVLFDISGVRNRPGNQHFDMNNQDFPSEHIQETEVFHTGIPSADVRIFSCGEK